MTRFTVPGPPVPKGRPRLGKGGHVYTPTETRAYERKVALLALAARGGGAERMIQGPVRVVLVIYPDRVEVEVEPDTDPQATQMAFDGDNVTKALLDAISGRPRRGKATGKPGVLFVNDRQVTSLVVRLRSE